MLTEPAPPLAHGVVGDPQASSDRGIRRAAGSGQHDPGTQHVAVFTAGSASPGQQQLPLTGTKNDLVRTQTGMVWLSLASAQSGDDTPSKAVRASWMPCPHLRTQPRTPCDTG
jgi:hypothetical protein